MKTVVRRLVFRDVFPGDQLKMPLQAVFDGISGNARLADLRLGASGSQGVCLIGCVLYGRSHGRLSGGTT